MKHHETTFPNIIENRICETRRAGSSPGVGRHGDGAGAGSTDPNQSAMALTTKFLSSKDEDEKKVKELVSGLKGIYVKSFEFENEGEYTDADLESIRSQLRNPAWSRIIKARSKKDGSIEVYVMHTGGQISGLAVLATELKEITVINIIGPVDLDKLTRLEGEFGIPELGLEDSKPKRKN